MDDPRTSPSGSTPTIEPPDASALDFPEREEAAATAAPRSTVPATAPAVAVAANPERDAIARRDDILVARALDGDLTAFNQLVEAYQDLCHSLVARMVPDPDQAADAVQEAFFSAYRNLKSYRGPSFRAWLTRIAVNAAMDLQRAKKRRPVSPYPELEDDSWQPPADASTDPEDLATTAERNAALRTALAAIGTDQRTAIVLFDVEGYDYTEIAEMTGVSLGTVKSRIHRGRLALRGLLADRMELFRS